MATPEPVYSIWVTVITVSIIMGIIIAVLQPYVIVPLGHAVIIQRFGRYNRTLKKGIFPRIPIIEQVLYVKWSRIKEVSNEHNEVSYETEIFDDAYISMSDKSYDMIPLECYTKDNILLTLNLVVYYKIEDLEKAVYQTRNGDLYRHINDDIESKLTETIKEKNSDELSNGHIESKVVSLVNWRDIGIKLRRIRVSSIIYPKEIDDLNIKFIEQKRRLEMETLIRQSEYEKKCDMLTNEENLLKRKRQIELDSVTHQNIMNDTKRKEKLKDAEIALHIQKDQLSIGLTEQYLIAEKQTESLIMSATQRQSLSTISS